MHARTQVPPGVYVGQEGYIVRPYIGPNRRR